MSWFIWLLISVTATTALLTGLVLFTRWLQAREPYRSVLKLRTADKLRLFRGLLADRRVPLRAKSLPVMLVLYLATPVDLVPDFIPVLGYVDDVLLIVVTLALVVRLTPRHVLDDHVQRLQRPA